MTLQKYTYNTIFFLNSLKARDVFLPFLIIIILGIALFRFAHHTATSQNEVLAQANATLSQMLSHVQTDIHNTFSKRSQNIENNFGTWPVLLNKSVERNGISLKNKRVLLADLNGIIRADLPGGQFALGESLFNTFPDHIWLQAFSGNTHQSTQVPITKVAHIASFRLVPDVGLVILLEKSMVSLNAWQSKIFLEAAFFLILFSVFGILYFMMQEKSQRVYHLQKQTPHPIKFNSSFGKNSHNVSNLLGQTRSSIWHWDLQNNKICWSNSMSRMLGMHTHPEKITIQYLEELLHPEDDIMGSLQNLLWTSQRHFSFRFRMRHAQERWLNFELRGTFLPSFHNGLPCIQALIIELYDQESIYNQQHHVSDMQLNNAVEAMSESFALWDKKQNLVMCNRKFIAFYQLPENCLKAGTSFSDIIKHSDEPALKQGLLSKCKDVDSACSYEAKLNGGRWLQINEHRTTDGGYVSIGTDITAIKTSEQKLVRQEKFLRSTITELNQSRRQLERQSQQLVELAEKYMLDKMKAEQAHQKIFEQQKNSEIKNAA
ncbi:MAG: PAS-domain containing protein [Pseudomonadota bacterium]